MATVDRDRDMVDKRDLADSNKGAMDSNEGAVDTDRYPYKSIGGRHDQGQRYDGLVHI